MFKLNLKNAKDENTIHAVVRMNRQEYAALRAFMHTKDGDTAIEFPYGVQLTKRGYGWYLLKASHPRRALEKMAFAQKIIRRYLKEEEAKIDEALKFLAPTMMNPTVRAVSYSNAENVQAFGYLGMPNRESKPEPIPAPMHRLQALANKFSRAHK